MNTLTVFLYGIGIQFVGIGFGLLLTTLGLPFGPLIGGLVTLALVGILLSKVLKTTKFSLLIWATAIWSLAYVVIFQSLGFMWFPGFVKDLEPFSRSHLISAGFFS
jgi:hypothetical protein